MNLTLEAILADNQSGSEIITRKALELYKLRLVKGQAAGENLQKIYDELISHSKALIKNQPNMVLLRRKSTELTTYFKRIMKSAKEDEVLAMVIEKVEQVMEEIDENAGKIASIGSKIIATSNKVMTISNSTLVRKIFLTIAAQHRRFEVYNLISHPPDEGIAFAEYLAKNNIRSTIIADSQVGVFLPKMNLVLIGADRLYKDGFINKAGTLPLCLAAKHHNVPVYLAVETGKILLESERAIKITNQNPDEVYKSNIRKLNAENIYYEKTPLELVHKIICENGVFETFEFKDWYLKE